MLLADTPTAGSNYDCPHTRISGRSVSAVFLRGASDCPSPSQSGNRCQLSGHLSIAAPVPTALCWHGTVATHAGGYVGSCHSSVPRQHRTGSRELRTDPERSPRSHPFVLP